MNQPMSIMSLAGLFSFDIIKDNKPFINGKMQYLYLSADSAT